jgi:hypothetical protein
MLLLLMIFAIQLIRSRSSISGGLLLVASLSVVVVDDPCNLTSVVVVDDPCNSIDQE